jgi:hypothetical protein
MDTTAAEQAVNCGDVPREKDAGPPKGGSKRFLEDSLGNFLIIPCIC